MCRCVYNNLPPVIWVKKKNKKTHTNFISCVRFSPDGDSFVTVGNDRKIVLYNGQDGSKIREIADEKSNGAHTGSIFSVRLDFVLYPLYKYIYIVYIRYIPEHVM